MSTRSLFSTDVPDSFLRVKEELTLGKRAITDSVCLVLATSDSSIVMLI